MAALTALLSLMMSLVAVRAQAFSPYTHLADGDAVLTDLVQNDNHVTIAGKLYPVEDSVANAIRAWPAYCRVGVIGPDGFPDFAYGQQLIHPDHTGLWLGYIVQKAR